MFPPQSLGSGEDVTAPALNTHLPRRYVQAVYLFQLLVCTRMITNFKSIKDELTAVQNC